MFLSAVEIILSFFSIMLSITNTYSDFIKIFSVSWGLLFWSSSKTVSSIYRAIP